MSDTTKIQWADATFNPWIGCTKVSPGCLNCYAEKTTRARVLRKRGQETWGKGAQRSRTSAATWKQPVKWNKQIACCHCGTMQRGAMSEDEGCVISDCPSNLQPHIAGLYRFRHKIFPSLCDWLDDEVPIEWLADFLKLIYDTPNIDWLLLTKRPENFYRVRDALILMKECAIDFETWVMQWDDGYPPKNVWVGTSVEDAPRKQRIVDVLKIPARVHFLSIEPLIADLGDLNLGQINYDRMLNGPNATKPWIDWVIIGGESGTNSRPCNVAWIRSIVAQCKAAGVAPFVKQLGSKPCCNCSEAVQSFSSNCVQCFPFPIRDKKGGDMAEWPEDLRVREFPCLEQKGTK